MLSLKKVHKTIFFVCLASIGREAAPSMQNEPWNRVTSQAFAELDQEFIEHVARFALQSSISSEPAPAYNATCYVKR
jgi:hypothetical protein